MSRLPERSLARELRELEELRELGLTRVEHELADECICPRGSWNGVCPVHGVGPPAAGTDFRRAASRTGAGLSSG